MHLKLVYGSGFPLFPPDTYKGQYDFRIPDYKRVDIGFATLGLHDTSFFLRRLAIFLSLLLNCFYLKQIIEYWNCFQMHNKKAIEI